MQNLTVPGPAVSGAIDVVGKSGELLENRIRATQGSKDRPEEIRKAAREFEALFINYLLKVMRETIEETETGGGFGKSIYTELFDQEMSRSIAERGALGISDLICGRLAEDAKAGSEGSKVPPDKPGTGNATGEIESEIPDFRLPVTAPVSSGYGLRRDPLTGRRHFHKGIDLAAPAGTSVLAPWGGKVIETGSEPGYGNYILIGHADGRQTRYAHLESAAVRQGDTVAAGTVLGKVGSSGRSTGPHLHFEIIRDGGTVDPRVLLAH